MSWLRAGATRPRQHRADGRHLRSLASEAGTGCSRSTGSDDCRDQREDGGRRPARRVWDRPCYRPVRVG